MARCARCLLPGETFDVRLDDSGVCERCTHWDAHGERFTDPERLRPLFERRIEKVRGRYAYDAVVGLSGGKDSTFVLHRLVVKYGLKVLAVTVDNGFLTDYGRHNIESVIGRLGVDHVFLKRPWSKHRMFYRAAFSRLGDPCIGCPFPGTFLLVRYCLEKRIPFFVHGRSPLQMFRNFFEGSRDIAIPLLEAGLKEHSHEDLHGLNVELDGRARAWLEQLFPDREQREDAYREFFPHPDTMSPDFAPEQIAYFQYHDYDEERMKAFLEKEVGYVRPDDDGLLSHGDCEIHDASAFIFRQIHGIVPVALEVAVMLRRGLIAREEGRVLIEKDEKKIGYPDVSIGRLCERLEMSRNEFSQQLDVLRSTAGKKFDCH